MIMKEAIAYIDGNGRVIESSGDSLPVYSITKTFIAAAIMAMNIDLSERISSWFDRLLVPRGDDITVEQLLNHTSGLRDYGNLTTYNNAVSKHQPVWSDDEFADYTLRLPLLFEPGSGWSYSNPGFWLLSQIIQHESGLDFDGVIKRYITEPFGLHKTRVAHGIFSDLLPEYPAEWVWHGLLISSAEDVARFMSSELVQPLTTSLVKVPFDHPLWVSPHYGYGLMVEPDVLFGHAGGGPVYNTACFRFMSDGCTICVLIQSVEDWAAFRHLRSVWEIRRNT
jgi:D-alanyl-D-alanine carboxypeptidase